MNKLKTLKEIKEEFIDEHNSYIVDELRQEAIKEIKEIKMNHLTKIVNYSTKKALTNITALEASGAIAYIKWKFNITDEDLK